MKICCTLCFAALLALPQLTLAASSMPAAALGQIEATVNFCVQADSKGADQYKELGKAMVRDMTPKELADARNSSEYKDSYDAITAELKKIPADKVVEGCRAALQPEKK